jgi:hypothetical protein
MNLQLLTMTMIFTFTTLVVANAKISVFDSFDLIWQDGKLRQHAIASGDASFGFNA